MTRIVGLDFDNTIVTYDAVIHQAAVQKGLIPAGMEVNKRLVRDRVRQLPDGDIEWQRLQALVYGPMMHEARLIDGVDAFVRSCGTSGAPVYIVSHKTEYAGYDETRTSLRAAALEWMVGQRFFQSDGLGLRRENVFFESTREAKIDRIKALNCTHFVDDLEEVFLEASFPPEVQKILYAPDDPSADVGVDAVVLHSWQAIRSHVFGDHD